MKIEKKKKKKMKDKYLDLARELKKLWNMNVTMIPVAINRTVSKVCVRGPEELEIGGRDETTQITALLRSDRILRES